jgi:hypothetical protein
LVIEVHGRTDALFATPSQQGLATRATQLLDTKLIQSALVEVYKVAKNQPQARLQSGARTLHQAMQELAFAFVIRNLNANPLRPQILWDQNPPHLFDDIPIPGSRAIGNNPDNIYRRIPLDHEQQYRLHGQLLGPPAPDVRFSVLPDYSMQAQWQQTTLALSDIDIDANGQFELTLNKRPAATREKNHVQLAPGTARMTIRESMSNWATDTPMELDIVRETPGHTSSIEPESIATDLAARLPAFAEHWLTFNNNNYYAHPSNALPKNEKPPGGLSGQTSAMGNYALAPDEVLIITARRLDARYFSFAVMDPWMRCANFEQQTVSLSADQAIADRDGIYTIVLAVQDPGIHNWLDAAGLSEGALQIRWQGIPAGLPPASDFFAVKKAGLDQLDSLLPEGTIRVGPDERAAMLATRKQAFKRRFILRSHREHA